MEFISLKRRSSQAKVIGTIVSISGAFVVTLYMGPPIIIGTKPSLSLHRNLHSSNMDWIIGGSLLTAEYILVTMWYIVQVYNTTLPFFQFIIRLNMSEASRHNLTGADNEGVSR